MQWCVPFPEENVLLVRPCLIAICAGQRPAAKLLSVLLYRCSIRMQHQTDAQYINAYQQARGKIAGQDTTQVIYRAQTQLVADMCGELTEKTLHNVAIPTLQLFGYLELDESTVVHRYTLNLETIRAALAAYNQGPERLEKVLLNHLQLEKFLIETPIENFLINKKNFQLALEKVLMLNRKISNCQRGPKPKGEAGLEVIFDTPKSKREIQEKKKERVCGSASASPQHTLVMHAEQSRQERSFLHHRSHAQIQETIPTEKPVSDNVPLGKAQNNQLDSSSSAQTPVSIQHTPVQIRAKKASRSPSAKREQLPFTPDGRQTYDAWCSLFKVAVPESEAIVQAANRLAPLIAPWAISLKKTHSEVLKDIKNWMYATDRRGFYTRGIKLFDVLRDFEGWQSAQERGQITAPSKRQESAGLNNDGSTTVQREPNRAKEDPYSLETLLAHQSQILFTSEGSNR